MSLYLLYFTEKSLIIFLIKKPALPLDKVVNLIIIVGSCGE